ncbi:MAG: acyltransferase [Alistipes sp.]
MIRNDLQSRTIDAMRVVLIVCVVMVHSYTSTQCDINTSYYPIYRFVSFFISLNLSQVAIPGFFFLSGYLFFHKQGTYLQHLQRGWSRLLLPYLLFNALILVAYLGVESIPSLNGYLSGNNLPVREYGFVDFLRAFWDGGHWNGGNGTPILHQFWYIRNLLLLGIFSPLILRYVRWTGGVGLGLLALWWIFAPGQAMIAKSVVFFTMGAWFSINRHDFLPRFLRHSRPIMLLFILFSVMTMWFWDYAWSVWLCRMGSLIGVAFVANMTAQSLVWRGHIFPLNHLQGLAFFIYAMHDPLIIFVKRLLLHAVPHTDWMLTLIYFVAPIVVIALCMAAFYTLKHFFPRLMSVLVGTLISLKTRLR